MGACAGIKKKPSSISPSTTLVKFSRKRKQILMQHPDSSIKLYKLDFPEQLGKSSAYSCNNSILYIIGGSINSELINDSIKINLKQLSAEYLPSLPYCSSNGEVHAYKDYLYYIGGVRVYNNSFYPTPFLRLDLEANKWEVLEENQRPGKKVSISSHLFRPGSCLVGSCIYIVSGEVVIPNYTKSHNESVYRMELDTLEISVMQVKMPICVAPKCFGLDSSILVLGSCNESEFIVKVDIVMNNVGLNLSLPFVMNTVKSFYVFSGSLYACFESSLKAFNVRTSVWKNKNLTQTSACADYNLTAFSNLKSRSEVACKHPLISSYYDSCN